MQYMYYRVTDIILVLDLGQLTTKGSLPNSFKKKFLSLMHTLKFKSAVFCENLYKVPVHVLHILKID